MEMSNQDTSQNYIPQGTTQEMNNQQNQQQSNQQTDSHGNQVRPLLEVISPIGLCLIFIVFMVLNAISLGVSSAMPASHIYSETDTWKCDGDFNATSFSDNCTGVYILNRTSSAPGGPMLKAIFGPFKWLNRQYQLQGRFSKPAQGPYRLFCYKNKSF